jgi:hypothetical protein
MTTREEISIEPYKLTGSKKIAGVWKVVRRKRDIITADGIAYTMDHGIEQVLEKIAFDKAVPANSKLIQQAISKLTN